MSKRVSSASSTSSRKKTKLAPNQARIDSYFRAGTSTNGKETPPAEQSRQLGRGRSASSLVSEYVCTLVDSEKKSDGSRPELWQNSHGTQGNPIHIDSNDDSDIEVGKEASTLESKLPAQSTSSREPPVPRVPRQEFAAPGTTSPQLATPSYGIKLPKSDAFVLSSGEEDRAVRYGPVVVDPFVYPVEVCPWPRGSPAPFSFLAHTLVSLSETRSRIAIINALTNTLRCLILYHPSSLISALYLLSNTLSPPYSPLELGIGASVISKAIQHVSGLTPAALRKLCNASGDPGDVAFEAKSNIRTLVAHPPLLIGAVYKSMLKIAGIKGQGAARQKQSVVEQLLVAAKGEETRYLIRMLSMNLRVGAVRTSILTALARALVLSPPPELRILIPPDSQYHAAPQFSTGVESEPSAGAKKAVDAQRSELLLKFANAEGLLKQVYVQHPNYDDIITGVLAGGLHGLSERVPLSVGIPLHPTLGSPARSLGEIYDRLDGMPFTAEFKYDGQRAQIHASGVDGCLSVHIFSRHLENMTQKYPDVVSLVRCMFTKAPELRSFIIDSEIVAIDPTHGELRSFQELSNRAKKDVEIRDIKVPVCVFAFDLMYLDGEILLERPFRERRALLRAQFPALTPEEPGAARLDHVNSCESDKGRECIDEFWQKAVESRCEGLMIKILDHGECQEVDTTHDRAKTRKKPLPATYEPDKRTSAWLKLKKDYVEGLGDSLDLVPVGAWHGNGRKSKWWSPILLAIWDPSKEQLVAVCKCMSGFSDAFYKEITSRYTEGSEQCSSQPRWDCDTGGEAILGRRCRRPFDSFDPDRLNQGFQPDVYFRPHEVWEIRGADVTLSPVSLAALGEVSSTRGLSLRFPRFIRVREDKHPQHASTSQFLAQMYRNQQSPGKGLTGADDGDLVDVELEAEEHSEDESDS